MGKLVRDGIPEIMRQDGKAPIVERLAGEKLRLALKDKLVEEATELRNADTVGDITEELADVLEVIDALVDAYGLDNDEVRRVRAEKRAARGGFSGGLYLKTGP